MLRDFWRPGLRSTTRTSSLIDGRSLKQSNSLLAQNRTRSKKLSLLKQNGTKKKSKAASLQRIQNDRANKVFVQLGDRKFKLGLSITRVPTLPSIMPLKVDYFQKSTHQLKDRQQLQALMLSQRRKEFMRKGQRKSEQQLVTALMVRQTQKSLLLKADSKRLGQPKCSQLAHLLRLGDKQKGRFGGRSSNAPPHWRNKLTDFHDLLFKLCYANKVYYQPFQINENKAQFQYCAFVGDGNNQALVKAIIMRRPWIKFVSRKTQAHLSWTQNKIASVFKRQKPIQTRFDDYFRQQVGIGRSEESWWASLGKRLFSRKEHFEFKFLQSNLKQKINNYKLRLLTAPKGLHILTAEQLKRTVVSNHLPNNQILNDKKKLLRILTDVAKQSTQSQIFPLSLLVQADRNPLVSQFADKFREEEEGGRGRIWIVKPGECSNRGRGIYLVTGVDQLRQRLSACSYKKSYVVQKYIERPFLYKGRKFDIRHFLLAVCSHGGMRVYWYRRGYVRTSSAQFKPSSTQDSQVHLTNDAVQKNFKNYGKYQPGNKLSYSAFQEYLQSEHQGLSLARQVLPRMRQIAKAVMEVAIRRLDPRRLCHNFQLFGLDFMITEDFVPLLIEVNANPCLEVNCPVLQAVIPPLLEHTLQLAVDPLLPPLQQYSLAAFPPQDYGATDYELLCRQFQ